MGSLCSLNYAPTWLRPFVAFRLFIWASSWIVGLYAFTLPLWLQIWVWIAFSLEALLACTMCRYPVVLVPFWFVGGLVNSLAAFFSALFSDGKTFVITEKNR